MDEPRGSDHPDLEVSMRPRSRPPRPLASPLLAAPLLAAWVACGDDTATPPPGDDTAGGPDTGTCDTGGGTGDCDADTGGTDTGDADTGGTDTGDTGDADTGFTDWEGERELVLAIPSYGDVCDIYWDSQGRALSNLCRDCTWSFQVEFEFVGDALGNCGSTGDGWQPHYVIGFAPDYYVTDAGTYDALFLFYRANWRFFTLVDEWDGEYLTYSYEWYQYGTYYTYAYTWIGRARLH